MDTTADSDPIRFLGREFVAYVAASDVATLDEVLRDPGHPHHPQVADALARCQAILRQHGQRIYEVVASVPPGRDASVGNAVRLASGGAIAGPPASDERLVRELSAIAQDVFPGLLLPPLLDFRWGTPTRTPSHRLLGVAVDSNAAADRFRDALDGDELSELFAVESPPAFFSFSSGSGIAVEPSRLPHALIGAAAARARLLEPTFELDAVIRQLRRLIADLRQVQADGTLDLPVAASLHGLEVEGGVRISLPWGWLRAMDAAASNAVGDIAAASNAVGDIMLEQGALLVTPIECRVSVSSAAATEERATPAIEAPSLERLRAFTHQLDERIQKTTLTLLMVETEPRLSAVPSTTVAITPFFGTGWSGGGAHGPTPLPGRAPRLTSAEVESVRSVASLVDDNYADALAIPTRRFASALSARHDVEDGLVDAVVAWESLFAGTDAGELNFRIAAAMAWLIGEDAEKRLELQQEISRLYASRSRILHRGRAARDVSAERDRAVDLGLQALRALLERRPALVDDENRGKKLILAGSD